MLIRLATFRRAIGRPVTLTRHATAMIYIDLVVRPGGNKRLATEPLISPMVIELKQAAMRYFERKFYLIIETNLFDFRVIPTLWPRRRTVKYAEIANPQFLKFKSYRCP